MLKFCRLLSVLEQFKEIFINKISKQSYEDFKNKVYNQYTLIKNETKEIDIDKTYMNFAVPVVAIYNVLHKDYSISTEESIEMIYEISYCSTEKIFIDLSFVQMAYYIMCNQGYLNRLMLSSLSEFIPEDVEDVLGELENYEALNKEIIEGNLGKYFDYRGVPELKELLSKISQIVERYIDNHFTNYQKKLTIEDIF